MSYKRRQFKFSWTCCTSRVVVNQLLEYITAARILICLDASATFNALNLTPEDRQLCEPKIRDMTKHYSPSPGTFGYRYILYLLFDNYNIWEFGRSPVNEALAGIWLYLYNLPKIEREARVNYIVPDPELAAAYCEFKNKQELDLIDWPANFNQRAWIERPRRMP